MRRRRSLVPVAGGLLCIGLSACTVPARGIVGVERGPDGTLSAVVHMCEGHVDGVTVYGDHDGKEYGSTFSFDAEVTDLGSVVIPFDLESEIADWTNVRMYAWSDDNSSSASGPYLSFRDVADLEEGVILSVDVTTWKSKRFTPEEFAESAASCDIVSGESERQ